MNLLIGSIKHRDRNSIENWVKTAVKFVSGKVVLLCLDEIVPQDIQELNQFGVEVVHYPTPNNGDINVSKFDRHLLARKYLETIDPKSTVLLTDTLDVVFQDDPFKWYEKNKKNKILLTNEGIEHQNEPWNMRGVLNAFPSFSDEIRNKDVFNSGLIMGEVGKVRDLLLLIYTLSVSVKPEFTDGIDQPAMNVALLNSTLKDYVQETTSTESFAVNCAVAGPTDLFIPWGFVNSYKYDLPQFNEKGVVNKDGELYCIVHQYNRVSEWNEFFNNKIRDMILPRKRSGTKTAIVVCGRSDSPYHQDWNQSFRFDADDYILCDVTNKITPQFENIKNYIQDNVVVYDINNLRETLNFYKEASDQHWWNHGGGRNIIWFYPHFRMMYFYKLFPDYDYYWFFDDDVTFPNGQLYEFIESHKHLDHDCMISYIFGDLNQKNQFDTHDMDENMVAYHAPNHNWLSHYPGPGDIQPENITEKYGSYFPLVRLSNDAMQVLWDEHNNGYYGYSEGYVPTVLNNKGLKLYSIYNKESNVKVNNDIIVYHRRYHQMKWENL